jgi:hypothetical protein
LKKHALSPVEGRGKGRFTELLPDQIISKIPLIPPLSKGKLLGSCESISEAPFGQDGHFFSFSKFFNEEKDPRWQENFPWQRLQQFNLNPAPTKAAMFLLSPRKEASGLPNEPYLLGSFHSDQPRAFHGALGVVWEQFPSDLSRRI